MTIPPTLKAMIPDSLRRRLPRLRTVRSYENLYETHAKSLPPTVSIGAGDFEFIGRMELGLLLMEGLKPESTLADFGCGTGRLAVHAIPRLQEGGRYIGIDISETMLSHAKALVRQHFPSPSCQVEFFHQTAPPFLLPDRSVDLVCAFSVFTHMEHEDSFRYLKDARRIIKDEGKFIFSCLPMNLALSRMIFAGDAAKDPVDRWKTVRNITTTQEFMDAIAAMAGWRTVRWYQGDEASIYLPDSQTVHAFGQSAAVLVPA